MSKRLILFVLVLCSIVLAATVAGVNWAKAQEKQVTLYKHPQCSCCHEYASYLRRSGFHVTEVATRDLPLIKHRHGVPASPQACHTTLIGGYVVEGHVPVDAVNRLLTERPGIKGISLPGMPQGSPGMTGNKTEPFTIYVISEESASEVYAVERAPVLADADKTLSHAEGWAGVSTGFPRPSSSTATGSSTINILDRSMPGR